MWAERASRRLPAGWRRPSSWRRVRCVMPRRNSSRRCSYGASLKRCACTGARPVRRSSCRAATAGGCTSGPRWRSGSRRGGTSWWAWTARRTSPASRRERTRSRRRTCARTTACSSTRRGGAGTVPRCWSACPSAPGCRCWPPRMPTSIRSSRAWWRSACRTRTNWAGGSGTRSSTSRRRHPTSRSSTRRTSSPRCRRFRSRASIPSTTSLPRSRTPAGSLRCPVRPSACGSSRPGITDSRETRRGFGARSPRPSPGSPPSRRVGPAPDR